MSSIVGVPSLSALRAGASPSSAALSRQIQGIQPLARRRASSSSSSASPFVSVSVRAAAGDAPGKNTGDGKAGNDDDSTLPKDVKVWERKNIRMWDVDIDAEFERVERLEREAAERQRQEAASGLGFGKLEELNRMDVDLSAKLSSSSKTNNRTTATAALSSGASAEDGALLPAASDEDEQEEEEEEEEAEYAVMYGRRVKISSGGRKKKKTSAAVLANSSAIDLATTNKEASKYDLDGWNYAPTRAEQARWQREWEKGEAIQAAKNPVYAKSKFSTRQLKKLRPKDLKPVVSGRDLTEAERAERRRTADDAYLKVKQNLLLTTAGLCGSGTVAAFFVGGTNLGASFAFGSAGKYVTYRPRMS